MPLNTVTIFSWYQSDWAKEFMQSVHRASRPPGMAYFIIAPIIIILMNLKLCKFPRVHLTRFRLVQRQSATVTAHSWALSCTLSCAWFYCFLRSYKSTLQLCGLSEHVDVAFITNQNGYDSSATAMYFERFLFRRCVGSSKSLVSIIYNVSSIRITCY